jgi:3-methyladenine DNA glycosylase/8-oxoguanine DNA glycosylase
MLRPFEWDGPASELRRIHRLHSGSIIRLRLREGNDRPNGHIIVAVDAFEALLPAEESEIRAAVRRMLRLDEDLSDFYRLQRQMNGWKLRVQPGGGRLLRCPTLFEDIVCTLCTTNIAWSGTHRMVDRLTTELGEAAPHLPDGRAFPTPAALAQAGPEFLRRRAGLGYRSDYVWTLAAAVTEGRLELSALEQPNLPAEELLAALRAIRGVGPYAAATLMMILGRYQHLAVDSEMRAFVSKKYFQSEPVTEAQIRAIYAPWERWQYLAYWFDTPA